ncbi:hypothetical protein B566_EDAN015425 [Ephemera danica]|nr:hypothetical protein B566_EDAN015425 [Ephemera danica]
MLCYNCDCVEFEIEYCTYKALYRRNVSDGTFFPRDLHLGQPIQSMYIYTVLRTGWNRTRTSHSFGDVRNLQKDLQDLWRSYAAYRRSYNTIGRGGGFTILQELKDP